MNVNIDIMSSFFSASLSDHSGEGDVVWGVDKHTLGRGNLFNSKSTQLVWKLPEGRHTFWVESRDCGKKEVEFFIS